MKNINSRLPILALAAFALILSSCSQQRYANRSYVKRDVVASAEVKKQDKQEVAQLPSIPAAELTTPESPQVVQAQEITTVTPAPADQAVPAPSANQTVQSEKKSGFVQRIIEKRVKSQVEKQVQILEEQHNITINHSGVKLIILGLIIAVIGWLIDILIPGIGRIFSFVAAVLVIIGLILILLDLL